MRTIDKLEGIIASAASPDGNIEAELISRMRIDIGFSHDDAYYDYEPAQLAAQLQALMRTLYRIRAEATRLVLTEAGHDVRSDESEHWDASERRYRAALSEIACYGESADSSVGIAMTAVWDDQTVWIEDSVDELEEREFLSSFQEAYRRMWTDYRDQDRALKDKYLRRL